MTNTAVGSPEPDDNSEENEATYIHVSADDLSFSTAANSSTSNAISATYIMPGIIEASSVTIGKIHSVSPLFGTWIRDTKTLQEQFYGKNFEDFSHQELVEWVRINVLAAEDELHETLGEISWKPWAKSEFFNREAYLGELVDVLHFVGNLLAGAGITDDELNAAYLEKMERNRERQRSGYTGLDKCVKCGRAIDDIEAHGGFAMEMSDKSTKCGDCALKDGDI